MKVVITPPQIPNDKQLLAVYSYLYQMSQQLNTALNSLSADNFEQNTAGVIKKRRSGRFCGK